MERRILLGIMLTLLLIGMLTLAFDIQLVKAEPTTIVVPDDYPTIQEAINAANEGDTIYVKAGTYYEHVVVNKTVSLIGENRNNTIIDGNGTMTVVRIKFISNVKIVGFTIQNGGDLPYSGLFVGNSTGNTISNNIIRNNAYGMELLKSNGSSIIGNTIMNSSWAGIYIHEDSNKNTFHDNTVAHNSIGAWIASSNASFNILYHNNFIDNINQAFDFGNGTIWDDGYPSGGNYWSDYGGADLYSGPYQNKTGSDGIGDIPYQQDRYPLTKPWPWDPHDIGITFISTTETIVVQGFTIEIHVIIFNYGTFTETFNVTIYANTTIIYTQDFIALTSRNSTTITFIWNTTGVPYGNYTISAYAWPVPGETDTTDNNKTDGRLVVTILGDINGDGKVNILDIGVVAIAFGSKPGDPNWNPIADVYEDGKINIKDIGIVAIHFGETW